MNKKICFPVLRINDAYVDQIATARKFKRYLSKVSAYQLDRGTFQSNVSVLDAAGNEFPLVRVTRLRRSLNVLDLLAPHPWYYVGSEFGPPRHLSFDDAKDRIVSLITKRGWYKQGGESIDQFRRRMAPIATFEELFAQVAFYGHI